MGNLNKQQIEKLQTFGITAKTKEEAIDAMMLFLQRQNVEGIEGEDFDNLILYCEAFAGEEINNAPTMDDEADALAREVENEDDEVAQSRQPEEEDDDEEELPIPPKKKPAAPTNVKRTTNPAPPLKKAIAPVAKTPTPRRVAPNASSTIKFNGRDEPKHIKHIEFLQEFFPESETQYDLLKQGVTLRALMSNTRPTVMNFDEVRINPDGTVVGNLYLNKFKSVEDLSAFLPEGFADENRIGMFRGESHPSVKNLSQSTIVDLFRSTSIVAETMKRVGKIDKRMGDNRATMQENLKSTAQKAAPVQPAKKK